MQLFKETSIEKKLMRLTMSVSVLLVLLAVLAFSVLEILSFRSATVATVSSLSKMVADNTAEPLLFGDAPAASRTLSSLAAEPWVLEAYIFDRKGEPFARYQNRNVQSALGRRALFTPCVLLSDPSAVGRPGDCLTSNHYALITPILLDGAQIGSVFIKWDLSPLYSQLSLFGAGAVALTLLLALLSYALGTRFQRLISRPIQDLAQTMQQVSKSSDFSLRARRKDADEVGALAGYFNEMLEGLQQRDRELARHRELLENEVNIRTQELIDANRALKQINKDLAETKEQAVAASRIKSQFLANMSHEIRTPMVGVLGMTELLLHSSLDERQQGMVDTIKRSGDALLEIIDSILDVSKIEAGKVELESVPFELQPLLEEATALFAERAHEKSLELLCQVESETPLFLLGDKGRLRQIILNLVNNAIKFTQSGEVVVRARVLEEDRTSVSLYFEVRDSGIGMAPEACAQVFEPFTQADSSTTRRFGGTGLGLTIVKELTNLMGGEIGLQSEPGKGTAFHFSLKLRKQREICALPQHLPPRLRGRRVLILDDNAAGRQLLHHSLAACGLRAESTAEAAEALRMMREAARTGEPYELAFIDDTLTDFTGEELLCVIGDEKELARTSLALMTCPRKGQAEPGIPGVLCLKKPLEFSSLIVWLSRCLERSPETGIEGMRPAVRKMTMFGAGLKGRVLLAEDNATTRELVASLLRPTDIALEMVPDGRQAVEICGGQQFDLILMDWQMPVMDGVSAVRQLRRQGLSTPIVALSANARPEDVRNCLEAGMNDHLSKPFRQEKFFGVLARWLAPGVSAEPGPEPEAAKILLAEDNTATQDLVRLILQSRGYRVDVTDRGEAALAALESGGYRLVLLDYQLTDMTGPEVARRARQAGTACPILALTAHVGDEHRALCLEAGMNACLKKPFRRDELLREVQSWLEAESETEGDSVSGAGPL